MLGRHKLCTTTLAPKHELLSFLDGAAADTSTTDGLVSDSSTDAYPVNSTRAVLDMSGLHAGLAAETEAEHIRGSDQATYDYFG